MKPKSKSKSIIVFVVVLAVVAALGFAGYKLFFSGSGQQQPSSTGSGLVTTAGAGTGTDAAQSDAATATSDNGEIADNFLTTLLSVRTITLDSSIFTNQAFTELQDFSRPLLPDPNPGRPNPFAPIGADATAISTQVSTSNPSAITAATATLNGALTIGNAAVERWFEYGTTSGLGTATPQKPQLTPGAFAENITGLIPNTTYYAKAMASIGGQTVGGNLVTWVTAQAKR